MSHQHDQSATPADPGRPQPSPGRNWDARQVPRQRVVALKCSAGDIVDFSARGMRLNCRRSWKVGASRTVVIASEESSVSVHAKCIWTRREGLLHHVVGLAFEGMNAAQTKTLEKFVADHGVKLNLDIAAERAA